MMSCLWPHCVMLPVNEFFFFPGTTYNVQQYCWKRRYIFIYWTFSRGSNFGCVQWIRWQRVLLWSCVMPKLTCSKDQWGLLWTSGAVWNSQNLLVSLWRKIITCLSLSMNWWMLLRNDLLGILEFLLRIKQIQRRNLLFFVWDISSCPSHSP